MFKKKIVKKEGKEPVKAPQKREESFFRIDTAAEIPKLPDIEDKTKIDVKYPLIPPYCNAHIKWDAPNNELVYTIEQPELTNREKKILEVLEEGVKELINLSFISVKEKTTVVLYLEKNIKVLLNELSINITSETFLKLMYYIYRDFVGLNELEPLMNDYYIEDVECNGINTPIYVVHRKYRNIRTSLVYPSVERLTSFVEKLAQKCGKYISYASPLLDGSLPDGSRVNAVYTQEVSSRGPNFTVRKFTKTPWSPIQLIQKGTASPEIYAYVWILMEYERNMMVIGATGTGKTTFLNGLAFFIPPQARIVSIEDSVTGDSKLLIKQGEKIRNIRIKEFVDKKIDAQVMTLNDEGKIVFVKPLKYIKHKVKKDIYKIITSTGRRIKVTQDHSLFTLGDNGLKEVKPLDLKENKSFIAVPRELPIKGKKIEYVNLMHYLNNFKEDFLQGEPIKKIFEKYSRVNLNTTKNRYAWWKRYNLIKIKEFIKLNIDFSYDELKKLRIKSKNRSSIPTIFKITPEFLEFCGLWMGDGSYDNHNKNSVIISNSDKECRNLVKKIASYLNSNYSEMNDGGVSLRVHSTIFYKFMKNVLEFKGYSKNKKIPKLIFGLSNEQIKNFIRGYFSADGGVKIFEVTCTSQSYELLEDLQTIFLRFGIISRINKYYRKDKCIEMSISSNENINKFKEIGFLQERKNIKLNLLNKKSHHTVSDIIPLTNSKINGLNNLISNKLSWNYLKGMSNIGRNYLQKIAPIGSEFNDLSHNDILWDKVKKVKKVNSKEIEVFDLSILKYEKFLCNNIFVHNTRELTLEHENWLPSVARAGIGLATITGQKMGEVTLFDLLKESFRQRPDYVIVGEIRGKEAFVLFQGMASIDGNEKILVLNHEHPKRIKIKDIKRNIKYKALTIDPITGKSGIFSIKRHIIHPVRNKLYRIKTKTGREVTVTPNHSLFSYDNGIQSVFAENLKVKDKVIIPAKIECNYANEDYINLIEYLPEIRIFSPNYIKKAVKNLSYKKCNSICGVKSITDYYSNFKRSKPSAIKACKFIKLMKEANINYDLNKLKVRFDKKSKDNSAKLKITNEFLRLLGYFISEGSLNLNKSNRISLYSKDKRILEDMRKCIFKVTGAKARERETHGFGTSIELSFNHKIIFEFLKEYCGAGSKNKKIPDFIFGLSKERIGQFLSGLYEGDGSFNKNMFGYYTISRELASDLTQLLLVYNIVGRIRTRKRRKNEDYEIVFYRGYEKKNFLKYVKPIKIKKFDIKINKINQDYFIDEIKEIKEIKLKKPRPVYDVSVDQSQSFIGGFGGILLHNSGHPSMGTMHADSVSTMIKRLETPPINLSPALVETMDAVCIMIQTKIKGVETRKVSQIDEIIEVGEQGKARVNTPFVWDPRTNRFIFKTKSYAFTKIARHYGLTEEKLYNEFRLRTLLLIKLLQNNITGFKEVQRIIEQYYKAPLDVLKRFKII